MSYNELVELAEANVITGVTPDRINAASIDVTLGNKILVERSSESMDQVVSLRDKQRLNMREIDLTELGHYDLRPGEFILAHTAEVFNLPLDTSAEFKLNSSGARIGLENALATWCDNGWNGSVLTLELTNLTQWHSIRLRPGDRIGQMIFHRTRPVPRDRSYAERGRYNGDKSVQGVKV